MGDYFDTKGDGTHSFDTGPGGLNPPKETPPFSLKPPGVIIRPDDPAAAIRAERDALLLQVETLKNEAEAYELELGAAQRMLAEWLEKYNVANRLVECMTKIVEVARTVYEVRERAQTRMKDVGAALAYEETREAHVAVCEALDKAVKSFNKETLVEKRVEPVTNENCNVCGKTHGPVCPFV